jgi:hypothetical protein
MHRRQTSVELLNEPGKAGWIKVMSHGRPPRLWNHGLKGEGSRRAALYASVDKHNNVRGRHFHGEFGRQLVAGEDLDIGKTSIGSKAHRCMPSHPIVGAQ